MKLEWNINHHGNGTVTVIREPGDPHMRNGGYGAGAESQLLYHVRLLLNKEPSYTKHQWIKKRMSDDGHMVDDHQQYVRQRLAKDGRLLAIFNSKYAVYDAGVVFNDEGRVTLTATNLDKK